MKSPYIFPGIKKVPLTDLSKAEKMQRLEKYMIDTFGLSEDFLVNKCREKRKFVIPRNVFFYICCIKEGISEVFIEAITGKDRCTVMHSCKVIKNYLSYRDEYLDQYVNLLND
jgi:chromosomal replication initiation ATPase DnaA